jgi:hypothetical protein
VKLSQGNFLSAITMLSIFKRVNLKTTYFLHPQKFPRDCFFFYICNSPVFMLQTNSEYYHKCGTNSSLARAHSFIGSTEKEWVGVGRESQTAAGNGSISQCCHHTRYCIPASRRPTLTAAGAVVFTYLFSHTHKHAPIRVTLSLSLSPVHSRTQTHRQ